ncbi:hypothetical protein ACGVWS_15945, partial [Enterobacteriaceae bacterium LUAb1]
MAFPAEHAAFSRHHTSSEADDFCRCLERLDLRFQQEYLRQIGEPPDWLQSFFLSDAAIAQRLDAPQGIPVWLEAAHTYLPD